MTDKDEDGKLEVVSKETESETEDKPKIGRPRKDYKYRMQNGSIDADRIFLFVPQHTIPKDSVDRFLELCDRLLIELGPKAVTETDVKDVATLFRDTIVRDAMYTLVSESEGVMDKSTSVDIEKFSKQIDSIQRSLKVRAADREAERKNNKDLTMIDILDKFMDDEGLFALFEAQQKTLLNKYYDNPHTDVDEYMTIRTASSLPSASRSEEEED